MTTGGYFTGSVYMGYDWIEDTYRPFESESAYYEWVEEKEKEEN